MSQRGNLSRVDFAKLITWLTTQKESGTLRLSHGDMSKYILFENGQITSAYSEYSEDSFRAVIRRKRLLPESQQLELGFEPGDSDGQYARRLIEKGYVTEREFMEVIKQQNQDILLSLFEWRQGEFIFYHGKFPKVKTISLKLPFKWIIEKGLERSRQRREFDLKLPPDSLYRVKDENFRKLQATENPQSETRRFFGVLAEPRSIREIVAETWMTEFDVISLVSRYIDLGVIEPVTGEILEISEELRRELAEAEILFSRKRYWEAWTKMRKVAQQMPNQKEIQEIYKKYSDTFREDLKSTIGSGERIPKIVGTIDDKIFEKFPKDSALGFLISRIDGKASIKQLGQMLQIDNEKLLITIYILAKSGSVTINEPRTIATEEITKQRQIIREIWERMQKQNYYEVLEVGSSSSELDIKNAYFNKAKRFHPDTRHSEEPLDIKERMDAIFIKIRDAYQTLSDPERRKAYDYRLETEQSGRDLEAMKSRSKAQLQYSVGLKSFQSREYRTAMEYFRSAIDLDPYEPRFYGKLAEVCAKNPRWYRAGILSCKKAVQLDPEDFSYHAILGTLYRLDGNLIEAEKEFLKVIQYDPENRAARSELKAMGKPVPELELRKEDTQYTPIPKGSKESDNPKN